MPEHTIESLRAARRTAVAAGQCPAFYIVVSSTTRHYGGPEEGGWWYDWVEVSEVRRAFTVRQALAHARELRAKYPQPRFGRHSCANNGEADVRILVLYNEDDPRWPEESKEQPHYE